MLTMMALGVFRFGLDTQAFQQARRAWSFRHTDHARIGVLSATQYMGEDPHTISLSGVLYPEYKGGLGQISGMAAVAKTGAPLLMVDGTGLLWGRMVIVGLQQTATHFKPNGSPKKIEFSIELKSYG